MKLFHPFLPSSLRVLIRQPARRRSVTWAALLVSCVLFTGCMNPYGELEMRPYHRISPGGQMMPGGPMPPRPAPVASSGQYLYIDDEVLARATPANTSIRISLGAQRAKLFAGGELALETQISTGKEGYGSPAGDYTILEKIIDKRSNLYGQWVDADSGAVIVSDGDSRKPPSHPNAKFVGTPMPYWLRVTHTGVGMHIGYVPHYPASHGCIRVVKSAQPIIYQKTRVGTPVTITR